MEAKIEELEAEYEYLTKHRRTTARGVQKDIEDYQSLYDILRNTPMSLFDVSMYLTVHGRDSGDVVVDAQEVMRTARSSPANLVPICPRWRQLDTLVSASPVGLDRLNRHVDTQRPMLAGAVGAMFPFVSGSFAEPGIEFGAYALNESPVLVDRFNRETGYCMMVIGTLGSGKSFSTKLQLLRRAMYDPDTVLVMLDPVQTFAGVNDALGGERITVGGTRGFNPLELKPTPRSVLEDVPDLDPWAEQIARVLSFFETFFSQIAGDPLGARKQTLRRAVQESYERAGITRDPATHHSPSPTILDVIEILEAMLDDAAAFGYRSEREQQSVVEDAVSLLKELRPSFRANGDLENLARPTEFEFDANVLYLDLNQEEGRRGRSDTSLM
ncbi:MAG: transfer complex protein, partial [Halobacteriales archaeon]|nr:transfer complex protein [Halobacteriales archaeon]